MSCQQIPRVDGIDGLQYRWVFNQLNRPKEPNESKPYHHDWPEGLSDYVGAKLLKDENENKDTDYNGGSGKVGIVDCNSFYRRRDTEGWSDESIRNDGGTSDNSRKNYPPCLELSYERVQGENSSFSLVVGIECEVNIFC